MIDKNDTTIKFDSYKPYIEMIINFNNSSQTELQLLSENKLDLLYNVDNSNVTLYLEKNLKQFKGNKPQLVLQMSNLSNNVQLQHIIKRNLKGFIRFRFFVTVGNLFLTSLLSIPHTPTNGPGPLPHSQTPRRWYSDAACRPRGGVWFPPRTRRVARCRIPPVRTFVRRRGL